MPNVSKRYDYDFSHLISPEERVRIHKRAQERAAAKVKEREDLRNEIEVRKLIFDMMAVESTLIRGYEPNLNDPNVYIPLDNTRISALKAAADVANKLLAKVMPDLKSIEFEDRDTQGRLIFNVNTGIIRSVDMEEDYPWL